MNFLQVQSRIIFTERQQHASLCVYDSTKYKFIIVCHLIKMKHYFKIFPILSEGHEIPPDIVQADRNECGAVQFSTVNNTLNINIGMFNSSTEGNHNY